MKTLRPIRRRMIIAASAVVILGMSPFGGGMAADAAVTADNTVVNDATVSSGGFESFALGDINNQHGWTKTGSFDVNIVDPGVASDMGSRALQISSAVTSGTFGDQTFSAPLADEAGETLAESGGLSSGTRQRVFTATMAVRTTSATVQPGLHASISPDRGDGARMSYLRLDDQADGVHVYFDDYSLADFQETDVATLTRAAKHTLDLTMIFVDGPANDVVRVSVDGFVVATGTSWENYYRDVEHNATRTVDSLLFRESGTAAPDTIGNGFLVDDVVLTSGSSEPCAFNNTTSSTMTLVADCTTDQTIYIPDGKTLDGADHQITAVDPVGGHFLGAVVQNAGLSANVHGLRVTADSLSSSCDAGLDSLAGIRLNGASGSITNNTVTGLQQGARSDGCQEGNAIEVRNTIGASTPSVTVTGNIVSDYQKTGVLVKGQVSAVVTGNTITGYGQVAFIAQNGIQVSYGATARVGGNTIRNNYYSPKSVTACGLIIYKAGGVLVEKTNTYTGNEKNVCTYGKGGTYSPN